MGRGDDRDGKPSLLIEHRDAVGAAVLVLADERLNFVEDLQMVFFQMSENMP